MSTTVKQPEISEADHQRAVVHLARVCGWRLYHTRDSRRSNPGFPDLTLVRRERLIFAELKAEKGKLSKDQDDWLAALDAIPAAEVYVWRPSDFDAGRVTAALR